MGKVGFLGIGTMGSRMSARLLAAGYEVTVWNRTPEKTVALGHKGAIVAATPAEAAAGKDIVLANLTDGPALKSVLADSGGVLEARPLPRIFVDMATIAPGESAEIAEMLEPRGIGFLRAPVSGTANVCEAGKLTIMTSGDRAVHEAADPYLAVLGENRYYVGPGENSRFLKLIHQMMIAGTMQIWGEGLVMGEKAGLDWDLMLDDGRAVSAPWSDDASEQVLPGHAAGRSGRRRTADNAIRTDSVRWRPANRSPACFGLPVPRTSLHRKG
jgi:3-hydroxyisobutyrate dehydrogenase-like beta-hydroxyacid dehydrogenase